MFDAAKYVALAVRLQLRARQIREDPPDSIQEYAALAEEIKGIVEELVGQRKQPDFDSAALKAARSDASQSNRQTSEDLDNLPPLNPPPPPPPTAFPYGTELNWHPLSDNDAHLLRPTDHIWRRKDGSTGWIVTDTDTPPNPPATWELDPSQPPG